MRTCLRSRVMERTSWSGSLFAKIFMLIPMLMNREAYAEGHYMTNLGEKIKDANPDLVISFMEPHFEQTAYEDMFKNCLADAVEQGLSILHFSHQYPSSQRQTWSLDGCEWHDCRGDVSYITNDAEVSSVVKEWANTDQLSAPMCVRDLWSGPGDDLFDNLNELLELRIARSAFAVEVAAEEAEERREEPRYRR